MWWKVNFRVPYLCAVIKISAILIGLVRSDLIKYIYVVDNKVCTKWNNNQNTKQNKKYKSFSSVLIARGLCASTHFLRFAHYRFACYVHIHIKICKCGANATQIFNGRSYRIARPYLIEFSTNFPGFLWHVRKKRLHMMLLLLMLLQICIIVTYAVRTQQIVSR